MDEYMAMIKLFAGNFAPKNWAFCDGRLLAINTNQALFSLLGTTYGGDGINTFGLPDLRSRVPVGSVSGSGLGQIGGSKTVTLNTQNMPGHNHTQYVDTVAADINVPASGCALAPEVQPGTSPVQFQNFASVAGNTALNAATIGSNGGNQPHNNMQPYLGLNYIICLYGLYPTRP
ncbi:MAG: phage tail protein [Crocinitomicaceae bacterium]|jgi:microcystin-dependent protein|nr:phage tail protein [Crocinitomicaceae bacterium]